MAMFAHLRREERLGLGIAMVAHVALVAALLIEARREVPVIPPAERMTVSLANDVSLESTAPNPAQEAQAAVAPVLAPESEPLPAPVTRPVPRQLDTPPPRQTRKADQKPAPPQPNKKKGGGTLIGEDFLKGLGGQRADAGTPAAAFGSAERASLQAAINRQLKPKWKAPEGVDVEKLDTTLTWDLNRDGSLKGRPRLVSQTGKTDSNAPQQSRHIEQAIRAVQLAAPFDLPEEFYDHWKRLTWHFDRNLSR